MRLRHTIQSLIRSTITAVRPAEKLTVSEWAEKYRYLNNTGSYVGLWDHDKTPYMREPMDELTSLDFTAMIFAGPARTGKSDIAFNWLGYSAACDPSDMLYYAMTQSVASEWSQRDLMKVIRAKKPGEKQSIFQAMLRPGKNNIFDKWFKSGMQLMVRWPSITELSGKTVPHVWLADYDRMEQDVEKQGNPFDLARKRTTTYKRFGMTVAEASPGFEVVDQNWIAATPHEAPPTKGILELYNRGDRRRWYWRCPACDTAFEPTFALLSYPGSGDIIDRANGAVMVAPCCGGIITPDQKYDLNRNGRWLKEGQKWNPDGSISGTARKSDIASFWLNGAAAGFQSWAGLVTSYLQAMEAWDNSGDTGALKKCLNTDLGQPYEPPKNKHARLPEELRTRVEDWGGGHRYEDREPMVPPWVRFLIATIDVQADAFVVRITGFGPGNDMTLIDTFKIRKSNRLDPHDLRGTQYAKLDPASYPEDWDLIVEQVIESSYPLADGSGRRMAIKATGCDSGGKDGVTTNAYTFWRKLRDDSEGRGYHRRFHLVKGTTTRDAPRRKTSYPDSNRRDRNAGARGDVPVQLFNSNLLKDQLNALLGRAEPGGGMMRFPAWTPIWVFKQLTAEDRGPKGWVNPSNRRNEDWDLSYYALGLCLHPDINLERITWNDGEPAWAKPWDENIFVFAPEEPGPIRVDGGPPINLRRIADGFL